MPGLLRGIARTAVVAGTASAVAGRVQRHQAKKFADRDAQTYADREQAYEQEMAERRPYGQAAPAPAAAPQPTMVDQLRQLADLRDKGILTDEEFNAQKARILS
ncbi:SHOCT domain-containing protein [Couchioplanes azureus]|uniref:SHOCT domain-containing protein n=1 Tax=Couchioplanes caeruleus TaxID=56438 RepID=UPI00166FC86C|nr:SHOCT domain-containing protein [Couchioplanes caeruleus]GGQ82748.1 hypothetical protein GCM10010166_61150 [Couchioplanes caeruleus subsp. azureus]